MDRKSLLVLCVCAVLVVDTDALNFGSGPKRSSLSSTLMEVGYQHLAHKRSYYNSTIHKVTLVYSFISPFIG